MEISISDELNSIINFSREEAMRTGCYGIAPDHMFLGIIRHKENAGADALMGTGIDLNEMKEFIDLVLAGKAESSVNTLDNSLATIEVIDEIRRQLGVTYPADKQTN